MKLEVKDGESRPSLSILIVSFLVNCWEATGVVSLLTNSERRVDFLMLFSAMLMDLLEVQDLTKALIRWLLCPWKLLMMRLQVKPLQRKVTRWLLRTKRNKNVENHHSFLWVLSCCYSWFFKEKKNTHTHYFFSLKILIDYHWIQCNTSKYRHTLTLFRSSFFNFFLLLLSFSLAWRNSFFATIFYLIFIYIIDWLSLFGLWTFSLAESIRLSNWRPVHSISISNFPFSYRLERRGKTGWRESEVVKG